MSDGTETEPIFMSDAPSSTPATSQAPVVNPGPAPSENKPEVKPEPTFTQADLDRIVKERLAREGIADLKAKAAKYDEVAEAQKTAEQKAADALAKAQREVEAAKAEAIRTRAALKAKVPDEFLDMLGTGTDDEITERATRLGTLIAERDALKAELNGLHAGTTGPSTIPIANLKPGATPVAQVRPSATAAGRAEAERRWGKKTT